MPKERVESYYQADQESWASSVFALGGIVMLVILLTLLNLLIPQKSSFIQRFASLATAFLPPLLFIFDIQRRQRKANPAKFTLVVILFMIGALIAGAFSRPLLFDVINLDQWLGITDSRNRLLSHVLISGPVHAFVLFATVRLALWQTSLFEKKTDGLLFSTSVAWGYSAIYSMLQVVNEGLLSVVNGNYRIITQHLNFLAIAIITGYIVGKNKFERTRFFFLPLGFLAASTVGGLLFYASVELNSTALSVEASGYSPWPGIAVSFIGAIGSLVASIGIIKNENEIIKTRVNLIGEK